MLVDVVMPKMGESIQEGKVLRWMKKVGERIAKDETILEISTDKVDSEIPSPVAGILARIVAPEQQTVPVGAIIAMVETDLEASIDASAAPAPPAAVPAAPPASAPAAAGATGVPAPAAPARVAGTRFVSPLVRSMAKKEGVGASELDAIGGSGANGRVTKHDLLAFLRARLSARPASPAPGQVVRLRTEDVAAKYPPPRYRVVAMDNVQVKMAEHMVRSVATSPHVEAIDEADLTPIVLFRTRQGAAFEKAQGFKLTFTPFIAKAVVDALKEFPIVNSSVEGDHIVYKHDINLGIAVASPSGLIVPVIRGAEERNFLGLARAVNDIAVRTRTKKLMPDEVVGGTFSITNFGVFGNLIGTPIINQPQVAILGVGAIQKRPVVLTDDEGHDAIGIRSMAYLTLAFDHRIIDGAIGGQFLARIKANLEQFDLAGII